MRKNQTDIKTTFTATGTASIAGVPATDEPLTSADLMREMKKEALDVYGTRAKFAEHLGERDDTIGRYFRNERQMPADLLMNAIAALGVTPMEFFARAFETRAVAPKGD